jgi:hypothetical protein
MLHAFRTVSNMAEVSWQLPDEKAPCSQQEYHAEPESSTLMAERGLNIFGITVSLCES